MITHTDTQARRHTHTWLQRVAGGEAAGGSGAQLGDLPSQHGRLLPLCPVAHVEVVRSRHIGHLHRLQSGHTGDWG